MKLTSRTLSDQVHSEADAYELLEDLRWHGQPVCPFCGHDKAYFLTPKNGESRATGPKKTMSVRRVWKCAKCRRQFSVLTNTIMHGTKIPIRIWLSVLVDVSSAKNGMSAREVARKYEITPESAWHMVHRIREAMKREPLVGMLSGTVEADETYIGGKAHNAKRGRGAPNKTPVVTLVHRETGEARSRVVPTVNGDSLPHVLRSQIADDSVLMTDGLLAYRRVGQTFAEHHWTRHERGEYAKTISGGRRAHSNTVEGFFSQLKRSLDGTYHHVSVEHLDRYLAEFDFRYSTCKMTDSDRALRIIEQGNGRRLPYRPLTNGS